jgi:hypothetical protein
MIAILLAAQMISSSPPLTPAEAARILANSPGLSNWTNRTDEPAPADGPAVTVVESSPTAGPFGEFEPFPEPRRLDGTLLSQPPDWYYPPDYSWPPYSYSFGYGAKYNDYSSPRFHHPHRTRQDHGRQLSPLEVVRPMQRFAPGGAPHARPRGR